MSVGLVCLLVFFNSLIAWGMSRSWGGCALGPLFSCTLLSGERYIIPRRMRTIPGRRLGRDMTFRRLFWHLRAAGTFFFTCSYESDFKLSPHDAWVLTGSVPVCVCACVCWRSLRLINVRKLGHVVCKEARSNYGEATRRVSCPSDLSTS